MSDIVAISDAFYHFLLHSPAIGLFRPQTLSKTPSKKHVPCQGSGNKTGIMLAALKASIFQHIVASFPGLAHSLLAVRNLHRRPGLVHHMMCAAAYANFVLQATNTQGLGTRLSI